MHERLGRFIEHEAGDRVGEVEELIGYHLEQAYRQRIEVGLPDARAMALAGEAAGRLTACGARASARGDVPAAANLLSRALAILPPGAPHRADLRDAPRQRRSSSRGSSRRRIASSRKPRPVRARRARA